MLRPQPLISTLDRWPGGARPDKNRKSVENEHRHVGVTHAQDPHMRTLRSQYMPIELYGQASQERVRKGSRRCGFLRSSLTEEGGTLHSIIQSRRALCIEFDFSHESAHAVCMDNFKPGRLAAPTWWNQSSR